MTQILLANLPRPLHHLIPPRRMPYLRHGLSSDDPRGARVGAYDHPDL
jgi:hypothetical protein